MVSPLYNATTCILFCVMVPVLSLHKTVADPNDSIADGLRVSTLFFDNLHAPSAKNTVNTTGNSSGRIAIAAARHVGVAPETACDALSHFAGVKRRLELLCDVNGVRVYDDFAHHPTAIETTLLGLRKKVGNEKIIAVLEPRSNTMRMGVFREQIAPALNEADEIIFYQPPNVDWALHDVAAQCVAPAKVVNVIDDIAKELAAITGPVHILIMSNGGFGGLHHKLVDRLHAA